VRVPDEAGSGMARITFSFNAWEGANVAPSTIELPISDDEVEPLTTVN
jgi:hypothetical protein